MNKFNKGKTIGLVSVGLAAISLAGVGFATWVVSGTTGKDAGTVSVEVAEVSDKRISITEASAPDNGINFDAAGTGTLLTNSNGKQDLDFTLSYKVRAEAQAVFSCVKGFVSSGDGLKTAVSKGYVTLPAGIYTSEDLMKSGSASISALKDFSGNSKLDDSATSADSSTGVTIYEVTAKKMSMNWGTAFDGKNPTELTDSTKVDTYVNQLKELRKMNLSFTITLVPFAGE